MPNGVLREGPDGMEFHSLDPVVFMMWPAETLSDMQKTFLRNMRLSERTPVIRMTYRFLAALPDKSCRYRILDTRTAMPGVGPSNSKPEVQAPMTADPIDVVPPDEHTEETESDGDDPADSDGGSSGSCVDAFVGITPVSTRFLVLAPLPVPDLSTVDS
ncbi:hypothetical protein PIB30_017846 [Stylosanthes scabra]|uniref:Uncharacterized protein n=1 Tax=Stylosanthes scabra TaxID=79078 RepID=A0ABU6W7G8_9FABA|nr:hypothetical protein [Stylosanthes scabra]